MLPAPIAIISAEKATLTEAENSRRTLDLQLRLQFTDIPFYPVIGRYGGASERSFAVRCSLQEAINLGWVFDQESVLWINGAETGLYYTDGHMHPGNADAISVDGPEEDYYSVAMIDGKPVKFAVPIDFDTTVPCPALVG